MISRLPSKRQWLPSPWLFRRCFDRRGASVPSSAGLALAMSEIRAAHPILRSLELRTEAAHGACLRFLSTRSGSRRLLSISRVWAIPPRKGRPRAPAHADTLGHSDSFTPTPSLRLWALEGGLAQVSPHAWADPLPLGFRLRPQRAMLQAKPPAVPPGPAQPLSSRHCTSRLARPAGKPGSTSLNSG